ncbi:hypothetical protein [Bacillus sp. TH008]|uniref:hypothetical protein n=1 Tax=Bacillus sp. TH008 TaxID=1609979 RepID=UPI00061702A0|nr:hypothetical protein [Bacillus sp. TH008]KKB72472.1 hypothetical protein TH62_16705 [Bacillus sp. TH008]
MWWMLLVSLIATMIYQIIDKGFNTLTALILLPTVTTFLRIIYDNSANIRNYLRTLKKLINYDNFDIVFQSVFNIEENSKLKDVKADHLMIQSILYELLTEQGFSGRKNDLIEVSFDKFNGVKFYVKPYKIYFSFSQTDNLGQINLYLEASGTLKFKNGEEIIDQFIVRFYEELCNAFELKENKYTIKVSKNTKKEDFMKSRFIKELKASNIKSFEIKIKGEPKEFLSVNQEQVEFVTERRASLNAALEKIIKLIL